MTLPEYHSSYRAELGFDLSSTASDFELSGMMPQKFW